MSSRLFAMLVWGLAAASVVFWALRLATSGAPIPDGARLAMNGPLAVGDLSRLLGAPRVDAGPAEAAPPPAASRFRLTGVVATSSNRSHNDKRAPGVALISVDGEPVRAFRVGDALDSQLSLWSVALRSARIGDRAGSDGAAAFVLELPPPLAPATGTLTAAGAPPGPAVPAAPAISPPIQYPQPGLAPGGPGLQGPTPAYNPGAPPMPLPIPESRGLPGDGNLPPSLAPMPRQGVPNSPLMKQ